MFNEFKLKNLSDQDVQYSSIRNAEVQRCKQKKIEHLIQTHTYTHPLFSSQKKAPLNDPFKISIKTIFVKQLKDKPRFLSIFLCFFFHLL